MSEDCVLLLPMLVASSSDWLTGDPARNLMLGICKRAWSRNQLMLRSITEMIATLGDAGMTQAAVAGPPGWALIHQASKSFRPISFLELAIPRAQAHQTVAILAKSGWAPIPGSEFRENFAFDYVPSVWLRREPKEALKLTWRLFPAPAEFAAHQERLALEEWYGNSGNLTVVSKEAMLASALTGDRDGEHLDWRIDAMVILREGGIDWRRLKECLRFSPGGKANLLSLARQARVPVPSIFRREPAKSPVLLQWDVIRDEYRRRALSRREPLSIRGFLRYLSDRWQSPVWQLPFRGLAYTLDHAFPARPNSPKGR